MSGRRSATTLPYGSLGQRALPDQVHVLVGRARSPSAPTVGSKRTSSPTSWRTKGEKALRRGRVNGVGEREFTQPIEIAGAVGGPAMPAELKRSLDRGWRAALPKHVPISSIHRRTGTGFPASSMATYTTSACVTRTISCGARMRVASTVTRTVMDVFPILNVSV